MITIRPIEDKDIHFLWDMLYEMVHIPENKPSKEELLNIPDIKKYLEGWGRKGDNGFIAIDFQNNPLGTAWYRLFQEEDKGYGFVDDETPELSIAIVKSYIGKGIGTMLLKELINNAKSQEFKAISLSVDPGNSALKLYERLGFKKCGAEGTSWTMILNLN
ncbi:GNAT family N-acetyltransferase [Desnuesiella massiliensis]|uniref:GNAT family N-acetyltransferase n=1 Tax=Desnuesiella massiliensis TaxID=1650662 RepID=UPI0006E1C9E2|nr:GNAT family N-acetyltransferase [Desnuesiella massiliensis]